jgi:hypothetical protein
MNPHEHYVEAERLLTLFREADAAWRAVVAENDETRAFHKDTLAEMGRDVLAGLTVMMAQAQVHATLATTKIGLPVVVSAPADLIDRVKVLDGGFGGVLFIPDELAPPDSDGENAAQSLTDALVEAAKWAVRNQP